MAQQIVQPGLDLGADRSPYQPGRLAWSFVVGAVVAATLIAVSLGQAPTVTGTVAGGEDWHGNVAASGWSAQ